MFLFIFVPALLRNNTLVPNVLGTNVNGLNSTFIAFTPDVLCFVVPSTLTTEILLKETSVSNIIRERTPTAGFWLTCMSACVGGSKWCSVAAACFQARKPTNKVLEMLLVLWELLRLMHPRAEWLNCESGCYCIHSRLLQVCVIAFCPTFSFWAHLSWN